MRDVFRHCAERVVHNPVIARSTRSVGRGNPAVGITKYAL